MRTLKFIVDKLFISQDPNCNFDNLIPGTEGYLQAEFVFSPEWKDCIKVVEFSSPMGKEYEPEVLTDGKTCLIPAEPLKLRCFKIRVIGGRGDLKLKTNKVAVRQNGGKA